MNSSKNPSELERLEAIGIDSKYAMGVNSKITRFAFSLLEKFLTNRILELGPAEGLMTKEICRAGFSPVLVEGSKTLSDNLKVKFPSLSVTHSLFEDYSTSDKFDLIIMGHVLEHVEDPIGILSLFSKYLSKDGIIWAAVPNAMSIHRQVAVKMGLLESVYSLNEADLMHGHRRVLDMKLLNDMFESSGLIVTNSGGYWLKPLSNAQIEASWNDEMILAFAKMGMIYPEIAGEIYLTAKQR